MKIAEELLKRYEALRAERTDLNDTWYEVAYYCMPTRAKHEVYGASKAVREKLPSDIYDTTAIKSMQVYAAGMAAYLTNPSQQWIKLAPKGKEEDKDEQDWLFECQELLYETRNGSNFDTENNSVYKDNGLFGPGWMFLEEDAEDVFRYECIHPIHIHFCNDSRGRLDTVFRSLEMTVRQMVQEFGLDNVGERIQKLYEDEKYDETQQLLHVVLPRIERNTTKKDKLNKPFASYYICIEDKHVLSEGGYNEMPYFLALYDKGSDSRYGYSPCMIALPDIKMVNAMRKALIDASLLSLFPPLDSPHDGYYGGKLKIHPKAVNVRNNHLSPEEGVKPIYMVGDIPINMEIIQEQRECIKQIMFTDLFLLLASRPDMTATQVLEMVAEKMLLMAPTIGMIRHRYIEKMVEREFNIMLRRGLFPEPPDSVKAKIQAGTMEYAIEIVSPLAMAQKFSEVKSISNFFAFIQSIAALVPQVIDNINFDSLIRYIAERFGVNSKLLYEEEFVEQMRKMRQELEQKMQLQQDAMNAAQIAKTGSEARRNLQDAAAGQLNAPSGV
jgi:hypothetical protein